MPIYLRRFYLQRLTKHYKKEAEEMKKAQQKSNKPRFKK